MANKKKATPVTSQEVVKQVRTKWNEIEDVQTIYANEMVITHAGKEFYLIFGEVQIPIILTPEDAKNIPDIVRIKPLARIAVTPEVMVRFASAISENVAKYVDTLSENAAKEELEISGESEE